VRCASSVTRGAIRSICCGAGMSRAAARAARAALLASCALGVAVLGTGCASSLSFEQLADNAQQVPVPQGLSPAKVTRSTNDGPGFFSSTYKEVTRTYVNSLPCAELQAQWLKVLGDAHRSFRLNPEPRLYVGSGQVEIVINDRHEHLGITIGDITNSGSYLSCSSPFIWSFNDSH
jgi:hypothetical protein